MEKGGWSMRKISTHDTRLCGSGCVVAQYGMCSLSLSESERSCVSKKEFVDNGILWNMKRGKRVDPKGFAAHATHFKEWESGGGGGIRPNDVTNKKCPLR